MSITLKPNSEDKVYYESGSQAVSLQDLKSPAKFSACSDPRFSLNAVNCTALAGFVNRPKSASRASPATNDSTATANAPRMIGHPELVRVSALWGTQTPEVQEKCSQVAGDVGPAIADGYQFSISLQFCDGCYGTKTRIDVRVTDLEVWLCESLDLRMEGINPYRHSSVRESITAAVSEFLDNQLDIVETQGKFHKRRRLRLEVRFLDNDAVVPGETYPVTVQPGAGQANAYTLYLKSSTKVIAHEMAHRMLGAPDEYEAFTAPHRGLAYEGIEEDRLERPYKSLMKDHEVGMLLPRHALAIAGILQHAVGSGDQQTRFSVAFSLDGERERSENFAAAFSYFGSPERLELEKRSFAQMCLLTDKFKKVGWDDLSAFQLRSRISGYISRRDVIEEMGGVYDYFPRACYALLGLDNSYGGIYPGEFVFYSLDEHKD